MMIRSPYVPTDRSWLLPGATSKWTLGFFALALITSLPIHAQTEASPAHFIRDLSASEPLDGRSTKPQPDTWQLIPYESEEGDGTLLYAPSFSEAPELTIPLNATGRHRISLGLWQPKFAYDGDMALRVKLSGDKAFRRIHPPASADTQAATYIREIFLRVDDLTDKALIVRKMNGLRGKYGTLAYIKLEPILESDVAREKELPRNLVATIDGVSYFHYGEYSAPEDVLDQIELYRHSSVAKVLWAVTYGDRTNFPTEVPGAVFLGEHNRSSHAGENSGANDYLRGEQQVHRALRDFAAAGKLPHVLAAKHAHEMGLEFDLMIRLGILGNLGFLDRSDRGFLAANPHCRQVLADGTVLDKASYAFEETQDFSIALIREVLSQVDADGINLCFVRGPHLLQYEEPVLRAFEARFGGDARKLDANDANLQEIRAGFMNRYMAKVHAALEEEGARRGRPVNLSVWVWPHTRGVWLGGTPMAEGLDVKGWIQEGWLDSVICQEGIDPDYMALGKQHGCDFVLFTGYRGEMAMSPASVTQAYGEGVEQFAYWDMDAVQIIPGAWNWLRRMGHRDEMSNWEQHNPKDRLIPLTRVGDVDVRQGLADAVYSGG